MWVEHVSGWVSRAFRRRLDRLRGAFRRSVLELAMGKFVYAGETVAEFDDRVLLHLQLVIGMKLRRGESFTFSWKVDPSLGGGRTTVWIHPRSSIIFKFAGSRPSHVNKQWLEALMYTANQPGGLYVVPEPAPIGESSHDLDLSL